ncbi:hypothetical protein JTB14_016314 [Gonioctena quinquepunctata]|nr:hypothetical protein JTB14_016314 [Gonioctena quinquepunctata]
MSLGFRLMEELCRRGHQVTVLSAYPKYNEIENYTDIPIENTKPILKRFQKSFYDREHMNFISSTTFLYDMAYELTQAFLSDDNVQILLKSRQEFDLVIMEYFMNDAVLGIGRLFKVPTVLVSALPSSTLNNHLFSNPLPTAYVPNILTQFTGSMTYWERFSNLAYNVFNNHYRYFWMMPKQNKLLKEHIHADFDIADIIQNVDLILLNSHPSVTEPVPLIPNMIEIGGFHINPSKKLPSDLEEFMNSSENGVILFSMGSNLRSFDLGQEAINAFLNAFSRIEQNVLWKFEEDLDNVPHNVKIVEWIPQQVILDHPNTKAFITHGGLLSSLETVHYGVPIIGIPVYGDQKSNIARAVQNGYAISIPFSELSEDKLVQAMKEVLENPKYLKNAKKRSTIMRDQIVAPLEKAMYWIDYVVKHNGSEFLQSPGVHLVWYKRHLIDIIIVLVIIDVVLFLIFYYIFKHIIHRIKIVLRSRKSKNYNKLDNRKK